MTTALRRVLLACWLLAAAPSTIASVIGVAKQMSTTTDGLPETLTIDYIFENFSVAEDLFNLSATDDLAAVLGTHGVDWTFTSISSVPASFANPAFDGHVVTQLINPAPTQSLLTGQVANLTVTIELLTFATAGVDYDYCNQVEVSGEIAAGTVFSDWSTNGTDPDPDGNGSPDENLLSCLAHGASTSVGVPAPGSLPAPSPWLLIAALGPVLLKRGRVCR